MMLLDYWCEEVELWRKNRFFDAPFIWDYLGNFGGNTPICGPVNKVNQRITALMSDAAVENCAGIGSTLEGLNNQSMYEFLFDRAWGGEQFDTAAWLRSQAQSHAGAPDSAVESAFATFWLNVLGDRCNPSCGDVFMIVPSLTRPGRGYLGDATTYKAAPLVEAWKEMLDAGPTARQRDAYRNDLADLTRLAMANAANDARRAMFEAFERRDAIAFKKLSTQFLGMGRDLDSLLGTRPEYLFGAWVAAARTWGKDATEADYYERNARTIVTTWMGRSHSLNDYVGRDWNGLLSGYYLGRWQLYCDAIGNALDVGESPDMNVIDERLKDFEWTWARSAGGKFASKPRGDCYATSLALFKKYAPTFPVEIATWSPANTPADFADIRWPLSDPALKGGVLRVRFQYESGSKALEIQAVSLMAGGKVLAEDRHEGWSGLATTNTVYELKLPSGFSGADVTLIALARGAGGTDSSGSVSILP